ncbi:FAD-dependent pyridine nucleotide-disulfide oxidoreductase [Gottschalkia acidurici 9a]|uniref:FAD-dependent pyridine nucleotide-disulfide oxidoreductase n=1 Tax=Gottschalkia acidurici (strain ATCC 7906 / DSM 604 / BCRC 14475 / CIP 104303 / KCTC 5404 / NCIMB 10678 / 9a) TaxID=1128398 RepID=K0B2D5_GOTA9|nr:FAD-dependent oxidoreductase [Gottschalkia acidurici]AFS78791.1 FAD-dependent pyridine nucleotide-disulfide oxidoreductase [Gottschalkia acidurici 9a]
MTIKKRYLIIGNGVAGLSAAEVIRKKDEGGSITIITDEKYLTYYRIRLSEGISKTFTDKELFVRDENWYKERKIDVLLEKKVENIDTENKNISLMDGETIDYDKLLIATGSQSFIPPIKGNDKQGVFSLRTIDDLEKIKKYFEKCNSITVLGGGLLGLEAAWAIKSLGKEVNVVEFFPQLLPRQLDEKMSEEFGDILKKSGLNLYLGVSTEEIIGESSVSALKLSDGTELKTDAVLISAGVRPRIDVVKETNIKYEKGIQVDRYMSTNVNDIYAAGDVVEINGMVIGLWGISSEQGKIAGENMTGGNKEYSLTELATLLRIGSNSLFSTGNVKEYDDICEEIDADKNAHYKLCVTNNKVTGGIILNDINKTPKIKKAIENETDISKQLEKKMSVTEILESL